MYVVTGGLGGSALVTRGLDGSGAWDFLAALKLYWENNSVLSGLFSGGVFQEFPIPGTQYPYCIVRLVTSRGSGQSSGNKAWWLDQIYSFVTVADEQTATTLGDVMADQISKIADEPLHFANGRQMGWYQTGLIHAKIPAAGKAGAWVWQHGPVFTARIQKVRP